MRLTAFGLDRNAKLVALRAERDRLLAEQRQTTIRDLKSLAE